MYWLISILTLIIDQICKMCAKNFISGKSDIEVYNGMMKFVYLENTGAAFGILKNSRYIFIISTLIIILGLSYILCNKKIKNKLFRVGAALIIGGGVSNLVDRLLLGYVIDYIKLSFFAPVCNLADYFITVGSVLLIIYILKYGDDEN